MLAPFRFQSLFCATLIVLLIVGAFVRQDAAQGRRSQQRVITDLTDVVNAIKFSPDSRTVAIARGNRDENRVELWDTTNGSLLRTIRGFDGPVWSLSFTPDSRTLVTGSSGVHQNKIAEKVNSRNGSSFSELKWWDPQTGDLKQRLELPGEGFLSVAAIHSPDGQLLATIEERAFVSRTAEPRFEDRFGIPRPPLFRAGLEADLRILDARSGEVRLKLKDNFALEDTSVNEAWVPELWSRLISRQRIPPIIFSPDGQLVAAWNPAEAKLWSSVTGKELLTLKRFKGRLTALAFSPDGQSVAAAILKFSMKDHQPDFKCEVRIWETATGAARQVIPLSTQSVTSLAFALNGRQLLVGGIERQEIRYASMELVDLQTGSLGKLLAKDEGNVSSIVLSPDGAMMAFQTDVSTVKLVDTQGWRVTYTLDSKDQASSGTSSFKRFLVSVKDVPAVSFLPDGNLLAGEIEGGGIKLWDSRTGDVKKFLGPEADTGSIAEVAANGTIAEIGDKGVVRVWSLRSGNHLDARSDQKATAISLSSNGKVLAIAYPNQIEILSASDLKPLHIFEGIQEKIFAIALSTDGLTVAASLSNSELKVWNVADGSLAHTLNLNGTISAMRFGKQNRVLGLGQLDGHVSLLDLQSGNIIFDSRKHSARVNAIAFSTDGSLMASGSDDRTAIIWDTASGKARRTLKGHDLTVTSLTFSPDESLLAVGTGNASVVVWKVANGTLSRVLK